MGHLGFGRVCFKEKKLKGSGRWQIGPRLQVHIIEDIWLGLGTRVNIVPGSNASVVADLINLYYEWDINLFRTTLSPSSAIEAINTHIAWSATHDQFYWPTRKMESTVLNLAIDP